MAIKKAKLTKSKQEWVDQFKPTVAVKGTPLWYDTSAESRYRRRLDKLIDQMAKETEREFRKLFTSPEAEAYYAEDASLSSQARILSNKLMSKFEDLFALNAKSITEQNVRAQNKQSKSTLHKSLKELSGGLSIKTDFITPQLREVIKASVAESTQLIKSIPEQYMNAVQGAVMRSITSGNGMKDLVPFFEKRHGMTKRRAKNIALDQSRKVYNSINEKRMQAVGITHYEWVHSGGGKEPRKEHITRFPAGLNGGVFSLDDPPIIDPNTGQRGKPGDLPNCKCTMKPVIKFDDGERVDD